MLVQQIDALSQFPELSEDHVGHCLFFPDFQLLTKVGLMSRLVGAPDTGQGPARRPPTAKDVVKEIRRATRRKFMAEQKIQIVLDGLRGEHSVAELCHREGIAIQRCMIGGRKRSWTPGRTVCPGTLNAMPRETK